MNLDPFVLARQVEDWISVAMPQLERTWQGNVEHVSLPGTVIMRSAIYGISEAEMREELIGYALRLLWLDVQLPEIQKAVHTPKDADR